MARVTITTEVNTDYTEIFRLISILKMYGIPHTYDRMFDGWVVRCGTTDAIQHMGSYGHENNLLETWGEDDVIGYLTATQVYELWKQQGQF